MLTLSTSKMTGIPGPSGYAQVHDFIPEDAEKRKLRGHLFAIVSTTRFEEGVSGVTSGREIITRLQEEYFGETTLKPFNALKLAVEKVISEFENSMGKIEISAVSLVENTTYCACGGGSRAVILREGSLAAILESSEGQVTSASGYPKEGDIMILGTKKFFERVTQGILKGTLEGSDIQASAETFTQIIHGYEDSGNIGAGILKFREEGMQPEMSVSPIPAIVTQVPLQQKLNDVGNATRNAFSGLLKRASNAIPQKRIFVKESSDFEQESQSKKITFSVGVILLFILAVSIIFGIRQKNINEVRGKYDGVLIEANRDLDEAIGLVEVSPDRARELFISAQEKLKTIESFKTKDERVNELRRKIEEQKTLAFGEYNSQTDLFLDLGLLSSGFRGDSLSSSEGNLFILDKNGKKIVSVQLENKKSKVVAGPDKIGDVQSMASYSDRVFILDDDGVKEVGNEVNTVIEKDWEGEALIYGFAGNMYVLDKVANEIYRYAGSGDTFGSKQNWLATSSDPDFSSSKSWVIDGAVYVLSDTGRVLKFSQGSPQAFSVNGVYPEISSIDEIYSSDETEFVYLLDKSGKRVVVLDKKGNYKAQYMSEEITNAESLVVSESDKKIIILTGEKLLSIEIKH